MQIRENQCVNNNRVGVDKSLCTSAEPPTAQQCNTDVCMPTYWFTCAWDECTAACGGGANGGSGGGSMMGVQSRKVMCMQGGADARILVSDSLCGHITRPSDNITSCNEQLCKDWNWMTTKWTDCIVANPGDKKGIRTRTTHCHSEDGGNAASRSCAENIPELKPHLEEECYIDQCPIPPEEPTDGLSGAGAVSPALLFLVLSAIAVLV